jgi:ferredoxin
MAYIVADPCVKCKYTDCVEVCPVDCFHEGANFLVIDPEVCIDCGACEPVCPTTAIFEELSLPAKWKNYVEINAKYTKEWPVITKKKDPLPEAEEFKTKEGKLDLLDPAPGPGDA